MRYAVRPMQVEDVPQANEIDRECFPTQWPPPSYKRELLFGSLSHYLVAWDTEQPAPPPENPAGRSRPSLFWERIRYLLGMERKEPQSPGQRIVGLIGLWIMADKAHFTTIGVRGAYRRQGIGELLLIAAIGLALRRNASVVTLEMRRSNLAAQALYEKYGFSRIGVRKGYYSDDGEDAVVMSTERITSASFQSQLQRLKKAHAQRWGSAQLQID